MATSHSLPSRVNTTNAVASPKGILITAILTSSTISIDGVRFAATPATLDSPIRCTSFVANAGTLAYFPLGYTTPFSLLWKYKNFGVTRTPYSWGTYLGDTWINGDNTQEGMIANYAQSGIKIERLAFVEDFIDSEGGDIGLLEGLLGALPSGDSWSAAVKIGDTSNMSSSSTYTTYYLESGSAPLGRQRAWYLATGTNGGRYTYNSVHPFSALAPDAPSSGGLYIKSWNDACGGYPDPSTCTTCCDGRDPYISGRVSLVKLAN